MLRVREGCVWHAPARGARNNSAARGHVFPSQQCREGPQARLVLSRVQPATGGLPALTPLHLFRECGTRRHSYHVAQSLLGDIAHLLRRVRVGPLPALLLNRTVVLPQQLPSRGLQHVLHHLDAALQALEVAGAQRGQVLVQLHVQLLCGDFLARVEGDEGLRRLAGALMRHADDNALLHRRVLVEQPLELRGGDLESLHFDQLLHAVDNPEVSLVVAHSDVPSVQPAVL